MNDEKIWLSSPHMGGAEMNYIQQAFDENWVAPLGPNVNGLENDLEDFLGQKVHVAAVSSGTAALHLAMILLGVSTGDEVLCQSLTFSASANSILYMGAIPVFVDSEKSTWNICPETLEEAIIDRIKKGKKPKAIITVSIYGMPYQVEAVQEISRKYEIPVIEDSAEALGSRYKGQPMGTFGDIAVISFNGNKIITTSGGGALILKDPNFKKRAIYLSTQAKDDAVHYEHTTLGYNYRMSNICAGVGRGQMEVLQKRVSQRRQNNTFYREIFKNTDGVNLFSEPNEDFFSNHWLSVILLDATVLKDKDREQLRLAFLQDNIESRPLWKPMHLQPFFRNNVYYGKGFADQLFGTGLCLPSGSNLTDSQRDRIQKIIHQFFGN